MTERLALYATVKEIGNVFRRLLQFIDSVGTEEIIMLAKIYLSGGSWRLLVDEDVKLNFEHRMTDPPGIPI